MFSRTKILLLVALLGATCCTRAAAHGIHRVEHDWTVQFGGAFGDDYQIGLKGVTGGETVVCYGKGSAYLPFPLEALVMAAGLSCVLAVAGWQCFFRRPTA